MKSKKEWLNLWENAPINKFINYPAMDVDELREKGVVVTDDWARTLYLLQEYSGGGYISAALKITFFWRALKCRYNIPYAEEIGNLFFEEQLVTFGHNRDVPTLLKRISKVIGSRHLDDNGELRMIFDVIKEKTGSEFKRNIENTQNQGIHVKVDLEHEGFNNNMGDTLMRALRSQK